MILPIFWFCQVLPALADVTFNILSGPAPAAGSPWRMTLQVGSFDTGLAN